MRVLRAVRDSPMFSASWLSPNSSTMVLALWCSYEQQRARSCWNVGKRGQTLSHLPLSGRTRRQHAMKRCRIFCGTSQKISSRLRLASRRDTHRHNAGNRWSGSGFGAVNWGNLEPNSGLRLSSILHVTGHPPGKETSQSKDSNHVNAPNCSFDQQQLKKVKKRKKV